MGNIRNTWAKSNLGFPFYLTMVLKFRSVILFTRSALGTFDFCFAYLICFFPIGGDVKLACAKLELQVVLEEMSITLLLVGRSSALIQKLLGWVATGYLNLFAVPAFSFPKFILILILHFDSPGNNNNNFCSYKFMRGGNSHIWFGEMNVVVNSMNTSDHKGKILVRCQVCLWEPATGQ